MKYLLNVILTTTILMAYSPKTFAFSIYVIRHGQAENNTKNVHSTDIKLSENFPLTELGRSQVANTAAGILEKKTLSASHVSAVFISPLRRTQQTAEILTEALAIEDEKKTTHPLLAEAWVEKLEGTKGKDNWDELDHPEVTKGESYLELAARNFILLGEICKTNYPNAVILVTHESPARTIEYLLTILPESEVSSADQALLNRYVFSGRLKKLLFSSKKPLKKFDNAEMRRFDSDAFCKLYKKQF